MVHAEPCMVHSPPFLTGKWYVLPLLTEVHSDNHGAWSPQPHSPPHLRCSWESQRKSLPWKQFKKDDCSLRLFSLTTRDPSLQCTTTAPGLWLERPLFSIWILAWSMSEDCQGGHLGLPWASSSPVAGCTQMSQLISWAAGEPSGHGRLEAAKWRELGLTAGSEQWGEQREGLGFQPPQR